MAQICRDAGMPHRSVVSDWAKAKPAVAAKIQTARDVGFDAIAQQALDIADDTTRDTLTTERGQEIPDTEWIARSRLRVETRLKLLAKWCPKRYGEKLEVEHGAGEGVGAALAEMIGRLRK